MNILWITTDQQQWQTIAGRSMCRMPNVQRLVDEGMLFNRSYAPMPVCCPVRAMWISGAYPWHNGVHTQVHSAPSLTLDMVPDVETYSQRLADIGVRQGFVGKWHASASRSPLDFGFDELSFANSVPRSALKSIDPKFRPTGNRDNEYNLAKEFTWPGSDPFQMWGTYSGSLETLDSTRLADATIDMMKRFCESDKPWHISTHFPEPHDPYNPHESYLKQYHPDDLPVPESFSDTFEGKPGMHRRESESWGPFTEDDVRQGNAHYFAYCTQIDEQIGRILDTLDACGQKENTLVAFTSDHGDMLGAHRMWIKSWMPYEEAWKVPLVVRMPGLKPGVCDHVVQTHDLPHTFLDLMKAKPLTHGDGRSLLPLLENATDPNWEDAVLSVGYGCEFFVTQRLLITDRFKYVFNGFDFDELYDLRNDPNEMKNCIDDEAYASDRSSLRGKLYELMERHGDPYVVREVRDGVPGGIQRYGAPRYLPRS